MKLITATRRAIERRMTVAELDTMMELAADGPPSFTGHNVTKRGAMGVSACWACVQVLADDLATLPFIPYELTDEERNKREAREHYLWPLLRGEANPYMTAWEFQQVMETWRQLWGNAYAEIEINGRGQVIGLWPWRPDRVTVFRENPRDLRSRVLYQYRPMDNGAPPITVAGDNILHIRHLTLDGLVGLSPIEVHRQKVALQMAMDEYSGRFYANGAVPYGILKYPGTLDEPAEKSLRESMDEKHGGVSKSHRLMILDEGMEYKEIGLKQEDAQFIQSMNANTADIARIYKVPPHRIGQLDRATFSNIEQQSMDYVQSTLKPNSENWIQRMTAWLLSKRDRETYLIEADFNYLLMGDSAARGKLYQVLGSQSAMSPDEMRRREGMNSLPNGLGNLPRVALNTAPIDEEPEPEETAPKPPTGQVVPAQNGNGNSNRGR